MNTQGQLGDDKKTVLVNEQNNNNAGNNCPLNSSNKMVSVKKIVKKPRLKANEKKSTLSVTAAVNASGNATLETSMKMEAMNNHETTAPSSNLNNSDKENLQLQQHQEEEENSLDTQIAANRIAIDQVSSSSSASKKKKSGEKKVSKKASNDNKTAKNTEAAENGKKHSESKQLKSSPTKTSSPRKNFMKIKLSLKKASKSNLASAAGRNAASESVNEELAKDEVDEHTANRRGDRLDNLVDSLSHIYCTDNETRSHKLPSKFSNMIVTQQVKRQRQSSGASNHSLSSSVLNQSNECKDEATIADEIAAVVEAVAASVSDPTTTTTTTTKEPKKEEREKERHKKVQIE